MSRSFMWWTLIAPALAFAPHPTHERVEKVQLTLATLHAANLTTARSAEDSTDAPFLVMAVVGAQSRVATIIPEGGQRQIRRDGAVGARPLTELSLAEGDSVQVLVGVLEDAGAQASLPGPTPLRTENARASSESERVAQVTRLLAPLMNDGAHVVGSVSLLLTNERGVVFWGRLDCVASCTVLTAPAATALPASNAQPSAGVVELTGRGGTYHLALRANRAS